MGRVPDLGRDLASVEHRSQDLEPFVSVAGVQMDDPPLARLAPGAKVLASETEQLVERRLARSMI